MNSNNESNTLSFLNTLIEQPLVYCLKSPDTELYDFGFGSFVDIVTRRGNKHTICTHTIHALCPVNIIHKTGTMQSQWYYDDTPHEIFQDDAAPMIGLRIKRVALSEKNDLWLDLGDYWMVFVTYENEDESWRFFVSDADKPHLVAADSWVRFD